jgi:hypothetical protein
MRSARGVVGCLAEVARGVQAHGGGLDRPAGAERGGPAASSATAAAGADLRGHAKLARRRPARVRRYR